MFVQLTLGLNMFITGQGFAKTGMLTVLIGALINIALDPLFIFGFGMGVRGAALATVLSQAASCIWCLIFLSGKKTRLRIRKKYLPLKREIILPCVTLGLAAFIMQVSESIIAVCFNDSLLRYGGDIAVGAMTICTSMMQFVMLPSIIVAVVRKFVLLIPLIYIVPAIGVLGSKALDVYLAEPIADVIAVSFTGILFYFQFRKALRSLSYHESDQHP